MAQELIRDGKLDRQAAAEALRHFLETMVRVSALELKVNVHPVSADGEGPGGDRSEEHTSELQSQSNLVCRLLLEKKKNSYSGQECRDKQSHQAAEASPEACRCLR